MGIFSLSQAYQFKIGSPKDTQKILYPGAQKTTPPKLSKKKKKFTQLEAIPQKYLSLVLYANTIFP